ncbi:hypothetical protein Dform_01926 [Dehalogenimonas formicexedens]|uniref:Uncharacterized protein n=1 Tax=Dehalogenimonas formicexedens TaxID=1839801 RepID=A0A1P8F9U5_9CHLR|nr:hypothetical protein Dform_01926 [Dehalogenimonas formicexedens]
MPDIMSRAIIQSGGGGGYIEGGRVKNPPLQCSDSQTVAAGLQTSADPSLRQNNERCVRGWNGGGRVKNPPLQCPGAKPGQPVSRPAQIPVFAKITRGAFDDEPGEGGLKTRPYDTGRKPGAPGVLWRSRRRRDSGLRRNDKRHLKDETGRAG